MGAYDTGAFVAARRPRLQHRLHSNHSRLVALPVINNRDQRTEVFKQNVSRETVNIQ
jgi:hypothetical protein